MAGAKDLHGFSADAEMLSAGVMNSARSHFSFPVAALSDVLEIGPTHDNIGFLAEIVTKSGTREGSKRGAFRCYDIISRSDARKADTMLWHAKHDICTSVMVKPTHYGTEYDHAKAAKIRGTTSDLFIQKNMRWNSQKILAGRTSEKCLAGGSWIGLLSEDAIIKDAFTIWANSIFGLTAYWYQSQRQKPGRSHMQRGDTSLMLVPDFSDPKMRARTAAVLAETDTKQLFSGTLDRAYFCEDDSHRQKFNKIAADLLGVPTEQQDSIIEYLQRAWTDEPSVTPGK